MKIIITELAVNVSESSPDLIRLAAEKLKINKNEILGFKIRKKALDARKKNDICYKYSLVLDVTDALGGRLVTANKAMPYQPKSLPKLIPGETKLNHRPVVVGAGPCGLFAALILAAYGLNPLLIERGKPIAQRKNDVALLEAKGALDGDSNVCFGEGGAGTFSDGKLTTRIKDVRALRVLETFVDCGADEEILYLAKPHLGTDGMRRIVANLRKRIETLGGEVRFGAKLKKISEENGRITGIAYTQAGETFTLNTDVLILAAGHSAGDTYRMLQSQNVVLEKKPCAIGFRIEHPKAMIDAAQYGRFAPHLGAAEYSLTAKHGGRGVYSFCMCPGGQVVCASSKEGRLIVNGMSYSGRDMENSNAAIVAALAPEDTPNGPLGALELIERIEKNAFDMGGGFCAPVQAAADYIQGKPSTAFGDTKPSYKPGTVFADLNILMPDYVNAAIKTGLIQFDRQIDGFVRQGLLTGVETRTSSPVRVPRGEDLQSINLAGLYPAGEGAGYAGGIVSAAVDGIRVAEAIVSAYHIE